jgi:aspartyl-tRNA(Asn)/glutamyl-tRNA(Gln) amidotransferase subunit A
VSKSENLSELVVALAEGRQTPDSLAKQSLERETQLADLNAFIAIDEEIVTAQAKAATQRRKTGNPLSPIDGVPIAVKDNYRTKDYSTTACSNALPLEPKGIDATIVANLRAAGAVIFGKTNMHEWAFGATNSTSSIGATRNPHNQEHITGGSSGGSAAAVQQRRLPLALSEPPLAVIQADLYGFHHLPVVSTGSSPLTGGRLGMAFCH